MDTVLLIASRGPTLTSFSSLLSTLDCHLLIAEPAAGDALPDGLQLVVIEFRPEESAAAQFTRRLEALAPRPTLVVGPDLPEGQIRQLLAPLPVGRYLRINTPVAGKREALQALLSRVPRPVLTVGQLHLDLRDRRARYGTQPLLLTATEFRLLRVLMQSPGQWHDCAALMAQAACHDVPVHLAHVRRKLAACSAAPLLRGNPRQGYTVDARRHARTLPDPGLALRTHLRHLF